jgi:SAM-dependent methyltransferase
VPDELDAHLELRALPAEELVRRLFRLTLRREPDPEALERAVAKLEEGTLSRATLLRELVASEEFERVRLLDDAVALAAWARAQGERPRELTAPPGTDERPIEIPWTLARLPAEARVLDVGYAFAEPAYLAALVEAAHGEVVGVDLAETAVPGLRGVVADVRDLPFERGSFDAVLVVSTLEHVGRDNTVYGLDDERDEAGAVRALRELRRVLARGGRLLVTVPVGEPEEHDWFVQRDVEGWLDLFGEGGFLVWEHEVYVLGEEGWRAAPDSAASGVRYGERGPAASAVLCAELHPANLGARLRHGARSIRGRGPDSHG